MWTAEITVEFTPLPPEKEEAYWETIHYFAEVLAALIEEEIESQNEKREIIE